MSDPVPSSTVSLAGRHVRRIGLGCLEVAGPFRQGPPDRAAAVALLRHAADIGVGVFDTADSYGPETSELLLHEALWPYDDLVIVTKGGMLRPGPGRWEPDGRPEHLRRACEGSLRRLGVDRLDVYLLHQVDPAVSVEESVGALAEMRDEGLIGAVGISNVDRAAADRAAAVAPIAAVQNRLGLTYRWFDPVVSWCEDRGIPFIAHGPLSEIDGVAARAVEAVGRRRSATAAQVALSWLLHRSPIVVPIPGTTSIEHLVEDVAALGVLLSEQDLRQLG